jgi:hypothetical protein
VASRVGSPIPDIGLPLQFHSFVSSQFHHALPRRNDTIDSCVTVH